MTKLDVAHGTRPVNARALLLPYAVGLVTAMLVVQAVVAAQGGQITVLAGVLAALVAVGIVVWVWLNFARLRKVRFGFAVTHAFAFVVIATSFNLHLVIRVLTGDFAPYELLQLLTNSWFGASLGMSALWGAGVICHLIGSILGRGWED